MSSKSKHGPSLDPKEVKTISRKHSNLLCPFCIRFPPTLPFLVLSAWYVGHADRYCLSLMPCSIAVPSCETDNDRIRCSVLGVCPSLLHPYVSLCHPSIRDDKKKNVGASHDAVANLLELIEQSVDRIETCTNVTLERAMAELIVKMMAQLLHVLGLVQRCQTKTID
jgi:hypothetical protein